MNILIPHHWLLEHLETQASPEKIQEMLSLCGPSVERIEIIKNEPVYDIEVTTNRVDSASVRGIAREAAAILPEFSIKADLKPLSPELDQIQQSLSTLEPLDIDIQNDASLCKRLMGVGLEVQVSDSPSWLQTRLEQVGQRPLNNLIDVTNYLMWEYGHPTHVFDYDKFTQKKLIVREAKPGEQVTTLDNKTHTTIGGEVVFDDGTGEIIDMPGLMGTTNTIVDQNTQRVLLFIDSVIPDKIRFASMSHSIRSQAAVLNEKHVDPTLSQDVLLAGVKLLKQIANAKPFSRIYDDWPVKPVIKTINVTQTQINAYMGLTVDSNQIIRILESLGCQVEVNYKNSLDVSYRVTPASYRSHDLLIAQDIIEEIARIYGYHNLPSVVMDTTIPDPGTNIHHDKEHLIKSSLADWGASEVYTYSLISESLALNSGFPLESHLKLSNSLTEDLVYLRLSLIGSHQLVFEDNKIHKNWTIFEMANTYWKQKPGELPKENLELVISQHHDYYQLKQLVEKLLSKLGINDYFVEPNIDTQSYPEFIAELSGSININSQIVGVLGQTKHGFYAAKLAVSQLISLAPPHPRYTLISTKTAVVEDLTFKLPDKTFIGMVIKDITELDKAISQVRLKDRFKQNYTFTIEYLDRHKQLSSEAVTQVRQNIVSQVTQKYQGSLIGSIN